MAKQKIAVTREAFLRLTLPERLKLWAEDRELEEYIFTKAFTYKATSTEYLQAKGEIKVAIIGSGPAGLGCANVLNQMGFKVTVFERDDRPGGLLMYGVPNIKLPKEILLSKLGGLGKSGVEFRLNTDVGTNISWAEIRTQYAAVVICTGSSQPRTLQLPGNELAGIYYAKDFLTSTTKSLLDNQLTTGNFLSAEGRDVLIIGGGETGTDCAALALTHGARSILQVERQDCDMVRISQEGFCEIVKGDVSIQYNTKVEHLLGDANGHVSGVKLCQVEWGQTDGGMPVAKEIEGTTLVLPTQMVLLALGFSGPEPVVFEKFGVKKTPMGTIASVSGVFMAAEHGVFAAGDARRGSGMVTWAFGEGYDAALECAKYLTDNMQR
ncbi:MAG: FAD-dependent oxidoreductase [Acidaminococcaceae bacterium]|nr:FAD-dependent oxidoreductase [Acidaminococcaceae bacterium]MDD4721834.1 FAD-dependent oxidoreductase [Acidaminococcaceae bacterium]